MSTYKTQGIILRHSDWQDYNRIYTLLTADRGKLSAIARGVRKIKSKQCAKLRLFSVIEVMVANGRRIDTLATAETVRDFANVTGNLLTIGLASFCIELLDGLTKEGEADAKIYHLLEEALAILDRSGTQDVHKLRAFTWAFALRLIGYLGYGVDFNKCAICRHEITDGHYSLSSNNGGLVCQKHDKADDQIQVSEQCVSFLRTLATVNLAEFCLLPIDPGLSSEFIQCVRPLILVHLNSELKTEGFLAKI